MSLIIYVVHPIERSITYEMCLKEGSGLVISLDKNLPPGKVERTIESSLCHRGDNLSYGKVLELLLKADKVITL